MQVVAKFLGGPLGGEIKVLPRFEPTYRVPVMARDFFVTEANTFNAPPSPAYETQEYRLEGGNPDRGYTYRWVNPTVQLRREIAALKVKADKYDAIKAALA